ncbi:ferritin family protein [Skermanella mucosa]|uniref:ferritin-like domain-containing protein n=1 Tax=Skermanella mucosa TaxID=1789672 RepID=UPI001E521CA8|nr:ferritin family protein [Skermanella mucosa]UEM21469.1 ferritin family protein [Skermanella mucosa]
MNLLCQEPVAPVTSPADLLGIALALEREAVLRYRELAGMMDGRGAVETAATFRALMEEERRHVEAVASVSAERIGHVPDSAPFVWRLPPEIAASWEELAGRSDLTPYRALSLAVLNEERAFAFYSYIVSAATDQAVREQARALAMEELDHAAKLRRQRRKAWRASRRESGDAAVRVEDLAGLASLASALAGETVGILRAAASALDRAGKTDDAGALAGIADDLTPLITGPGPAPASVDPVLGEGRNLRSALAALERMAEIFSDIAEGTRDEAVWLEAQRIFGIVVGHAVRLAERSR